MSIFEKQPHNIKNWFLQRKKGSCVATGLIGYMALSLETQQRLVAFLKELHWHKL